MAARRTFGAAPASNASCQRAAQRHHWSPSLKPAKPCCGHRCGQVVADGLRERQELVGSDNAHDVQPGIVATVLAAPSAVVAGQRIE